MPVYEFYCQECGYRVEHRESVYLSPCPRCGIPLRRKYSVNVMSTFQPHFNHSVGQYVNNQREFSDALKRGGDAASERTGIYHNYRPIDPRELSPGNNGEGMEETLKGNYDAGKSKRTDV